MLESEERLSDLIFSHLPRPAIDEFYERGLADSATIVAEYLARV